MPYAAAYLTVSEYLSTSRLCSLSRMTSRSVLTLNPERRFFPNYFSLDPQSQTRDSKPADLHELRLLFN